uniref:Centrosomal protein 295 n=1 Tax=Sciurus vulgaris TaxID=55149 RepID=A0A8D2DYE1_SCIVU
MEQPREWLPHIQDLTRDDQQSISHADKSNSDDSWLFSEDVSAKQSGNPNFYQDRDPMRVSISREQVFFGSPMARVPINCLQPAAQESVCSNDGDETVKVKESDVENHAVLSYALEEEEYTHLGPAVNPNDKADTQIFHEPLSSVTLSTGSFVSYENTDLSLTDPESFSEHTDYQEQESTASKEEEMNILRSIIPSTQAIYQQQKSSDVHKSLLPAVEEFTSRHTHFQQTTDKYINEADLMPEKRDLQELEHIFPNLHRQLFKPLEPHPDFDLSSLSSGISQDDRNFYQSSDSSSERHCATASKSTVSFTALRRASLHSFLNTSLNQQPNPNLAQAAAQSFATDDIIEGSEQSFQQLLPEFSSQEGSQHADLPSIFSIEARDTSQGMKNQTEILQNKKKGVHFQLPRGNLNSTYSSSDEANVFHQLQVQHSTPCSSSSSEYSIKQQESRKERWDFKELSKKEALIMLPSQELTEGENETCGVLATDPHEEIDSQLCVRTVEMGTSVQPPHSFSIQNEKYFENSTKTETLEVISLSQTTQLESFKSSGSFAVQSSIPIWETESGHGIMEEPELTLVSTSDISIAETDFANLTLEEERENEAKSYLQVNEFILSETENSDYPATSELSMQKSTKSTEALPKCTVMAGSLQEAFIKRKKKFLERSYQRQKEIRNKIKVTENSQIKTVKEKQATGSSVSHLKGVNKVKMSFTEERKTAQALMHQRALRLYNQLAEVKQQKIEKAKQEAYALNRARAKEFHKKTLEKLRAKNAC